MTDTSQDQAWLEEQAAEYTDLAAGASFVDQVRDKETDEMLEYQLIWEGGDLGVALTPVESNDGVGVQVSRVTGKGFPFGIKNVGPGDVLLSINVRDTTKMTLDQVVAYLQECDLPATLRFRKLSPDLDRVEPRAVPVPSNFIVTGESAPPAGPTSPSGSRPTASTRYSKYRQQQYAHTNPYLRPNGAPPQFGRATEGAAEVRWSAKTKASPGSHPPSDQVTPPGPSRSTAPAVLPPPAPVAEPAAESSEEEEEESEEEESEEEESEEEEWVEEKDERVEQHVQIQAAKQQPVKVAAIPKPEAPKVVEDHHEEEEEEEDESEESEEEEEDEEEEEETAAPAQAAQEEDLDVMGKLTMGSEGDASDSGSWDESFAVDEERAKAEHAAIAQSPMVEPPKRETAQYTAPFNTRDTARRETAQFMGGMGKRDGAQRGGPNSQRMELDELEHGKHDENEGFDVIVSDSSEEEEDDSSRHASSRSSGRNMSAHQLRKKSSAPMLGDYSIDSSDIPIVPAEGTSAINVVDGVPEEAEEEEDIRGSSHVGGTWATLGESQFRGSRMTVNSVQEAMKQRQPMTPLQEACAKGNLRSLMHHITVNGPDDLIQCEANHGQTCLHLAVKSGNVQVVKHILESFSPVEDLVNLEDDKANTALHFAATKSPGMVHVLLESGANANVKNSRRLTPLIISVITSRDDSVLIPRMLLKYGANPNDMHDSQTVIHTAIGRGMLQIAGALVRAGAKMDVEDNEGHSVFEKLDRKSLRVLISHIYFPPTYITDKERTECMLCHKRIKFGRRKINCTHCGRFCCGDCCSLNVEMYKFPMGFPGRIRKGAGNHDMQKVCKTCYSVFKERGDTPQKKESKFVGRVVGIEWQEVNPNKLAKVEAAKRHGGTDV